MWIWIILAVWFVGIFVSYFLFGKKLGSSKVENIYFSIIWPLLIPLYILHLIIPKSGQ